MRVISPQGTGSVHLFGCSYTDNPRLNNHVPLNKSEQTDHRRQPILGGCQILSKKEEIKKISLATICLEIYKVLKSEALKYSNSLKAMEVPQQLQVQKGLHKSACPASECPGEEISVSAFS